MQPPFCIAAGYNTPSDKRAVAAVFKDGMAFRRVPDRLMRDFYIRPADGSIQRGSLLAYGTYGNLTLGVIKWVTHIVGHSSGGIGPSGIDRIDGRLTLYLKLNVISHYSVLHVQGVYSLMRMRQTIILIASLLLATLCKTATASPTDTPETIVNEAWTSWTVGDGFIYWTKSCNTLDGDYLSTIKRRPLTGSVVTTLSRIDAQFDCEAHSHLTPQDGDLYYYDSQNHEIRFESGDPDEDEPQTIVTFSSGSYPIGRKLAIYGDHIYWIANNNDIQRANRSGGSATTFVDTGNASLSDIAADAWRIWWTTGGGVRYVAAACSPLPCAADPAIVSGVSADYLLPLTGQYGGIQPDIIWTKIGGTDQVQRYRCTGLFNPICTTTTLHTASSSLRNIYQTALGLDVNDASAVFWKERLSDLDIRLYRDTIAGGSPTAVQSGLNADWRTYTDEAYVYFAVSSTEISRLPHGAAEVTTDLLALTDIEVTQGIQRLNNDVKLIADKPTFVRVFGDILSTGQAEHVQVQLVGMRNGAALPGSPLDPFDGSETLGWIAQQRSESDGGWNFQLPTSWRSGDVTLIAELDPNNLYEDGGTNNSLQLEIDFDGSPNTCIVFAPVRTAQGKPSLAGNYGAETVQRFIDFMPIDGARTYRQSQSYEELETCWWEGIVPYPCYGPYELYDNSWVADKTELMTSVIARRGFSDDPDECDASGAQVHYAGMAHPRSDTGTTNGTGNYYINALWFKLQKDGPDGADDWEWPQAGGTLAHEVTHNYDRQHIACTGNESDTDPNYPYPPCQLDDDLDTDSDDVTFLTEGIFGFHLDSRRPIMPTEAGPLMSYASARWIDDYTYEDIYDELIGRGRNTATPEDSDLIVLTGIVDQQNERGELRHAYIVPPDVQTATLQENLIHSARNVTGYHVRLYDAAAGLLGDHAVPLEPFVDRDDGPTADSFLFSVPRPAAAVASIELLYNTTVLMRLQPGNTVPTNSITQPTAGSIVDEPFVIEFEAQDADQHDQLLSIVQYSIDNGSSWRTLQTQVGGYGTTRVLALDAAQLVPGSVGQTARVRVLTSDGINTAIATSDAFTVPNRAPQSIIAQPQEGETFPAGQSITLRGTAWDAETGTLDRSALSWRVNGDVAGNSDLVVVDGLAPGFHTVTLDASDGSRSSAAADVEFEVLPLVVPEGEQPTVDAYCNDDAYETAVQLSLQPVIDAATAFLLQHDDDLYVCATGLQSNDISSFEVLIDTNRSGGSFITASDSAFRIDEGGNATTRRGDGGNAWVQSGPGGLTARMRLRGDERWQAEMRIDGDVIGDFDGVLALALRYTFPFFASELNFMWPHSADPGQAGTWAHSYVLPQPQISAMSPLSATVGSEGVTLVVNGSDLNNGMAVRWNGFALPTTYVNSSTLHAAVGVDQLDTTGSFEVVVQADGTGVNSTPFDFRVVNPEPVLTQLTPDSVPAGASAQTVTLTGNEFVAGAVVLWNGEPLPTTFVNSGELRAALTADLLRDGRGVTITVLNPEPGGGSSSQTFTIATVPTTITLTASQTDSSAMFQLLWLLLFVGIFSLTLLAWRQDIL